MKAWKYLILLVIVSLLGACGSDGLPDPGDPTNPDPVGDQVPHVLQLDKKTVSVGEIMYVAGENFLPTNQGRTELVFNGVFQGDDGVVEETSFVIQPLFDGTYYTDGTFAGNSVLEGTDLLRISRFGPFQVPFSTTGNKTGEFKGTLVARNVMFDGTILTDDDPPTVTVSVRRSIAIKAFEPFLGLDENGNPRMAGCGAPAIRALHKLPYYLQVEAVGFTPEYWVYEFSGINGSEDVISYTHVADGPVDEVGAPWATKPEPVIFNPVPEDVSFYISAIRITATLENGDFVETAVPMTVHRPMEFHLSMKEAEPAQYYEPVPVSGCMPGSIDNKVTYQETHSEARQNGVSVMVGKNWSQSHSDSQSQNWSNGISETNSHGVTNSDTEMHSESEYLAEAYGVSYNSTEANSASYSSTDGQDWNYSVSSGTSNDELQSATDTVYGEVSGSITTEVSGEASVPGVAKVGGKVGTTVGASVGGSMAGTNGTVVGSHTDTGSSMGGNSSDTQAFGSVTTDSKGESMNSTYALTSVDSLSSTTSKSDVHSDSVTYTFGESVSSSDVVSVGETETWSETWVNTTTDSTLMSYSAKIPNNRYGIWYRQTVRYVRRAQLYTYNVCGVRDLMGEMYFSEWRWSPALAIGDTCTGSIIPKADLPTAQCVVKPCD